MTQKEFASLGGNARAQKLTKDRRIEIARNAGLASAKKRRVEELEEQVAALTAQLEASKPASQVVNNP